MNNYLVLLDYWKSVSFHNIGIKTHFIDTTPANEVSFTTVLPGSALMGQRRKAHTS